MLFENRGIIDNKLISSPIHILSHEYEEIEIRVPKTIEFRKRILYIFIKKRKILLSLAGYEPNSLISLSFYALVYDVLEFLIL